MGGTQQLARLAGGVAGLGLAFAAAAPFSGVPPQGVSGAPAPARIEVRTLASGELAVDPLGVVLPATAFPDPGSRGGPSARVKLTNIAPVPIRVSVRLTGLTPALTDAATVRGSAAGAVLLDGSLAQAARWSTPAGVLSPGETTTLRMRFKLMRGLRPDAYGGRLDVRQVEVKGLPLVTPPTATTPPAPTTPMGTTPMPTATTPTTPERSR